MGQEAGQDAMESEAEIFGRDLNSDLTNKINSLPIIGDIIGVSTNLASRPLIADKLYTHHILRRTRSKMLLLLPSETGTPRTVNMIPCTTSPKILPPRWSRHTTWQTRHLLRLMCDVI